MTNLDTILDALADALVEKIAARLPPGGQQQTYTIDQLAERYGMSKASIARRVRAGEFGETINAGSRTHLVTAAGVAKFEADHTGPAHGGNAGAYRTRRRTQHRDPGPI